MVRVALVACLLLLGGCGAKREARLVEATAKLEEETLRLEQLVEEREDLNKTLRESEFARQTASTLKVEISPEASAQIDEHLQRYQTRIQELDTVIGVQRTRVEDAKQVVESLRL